MEGPTLNLGANASWPLNRGANEGHLFFFLLSLFPWGEALRDLLGIGAAIQLRYASVRKNYFPKSGSGGVTWNLKVFNQEGCQKRQVLVA